MHFNDLFWMFLNLLDVALDFPLSVEPFDIYSKKDFSGIP